MREAAAVVGVHVKFSGRDLFVDPYALSAQVDRQDGISRRKEIVHIGCVLVLIGVGLNVGVDLRCHLVSRNRGFLGKCDKKLSAHRTTHPQNYPNG